MFKTLRIICTIIAAILAAAVLPVGAFFDMPWAILCGGLSFALYLAMLFFKQAQEKKEGTEEVIIPPKSEDEDSTSSKKE